MASLTMLLLDKKRDLDVLKAMGMPLPMMEQAFGFQGLAINVVGGLVGILVGAMLVMGQAQFGGSNCKVRWCPPIPCGLRVDGCDGHTGVVVVVGGLGSSAMVRHLLRNQVA